MIEKKCEYCGKVMELPERKENQRFCSASCSAKSRTLPVDMDFDWKKLRDGLYECRYHPGGQIGCTNRQCDKCGWNPEVEPRPGRKQSGRGILSRRQRVPPKQHDMEDKTNAEK